MVSKYTIKLLFSGLIFLSLCDFITSLLFGMQRVWRSGGWG